jgi:hypothetical protein
MHKKQNLPEKPCLVCGRPFAWRKKWRDDWEQVKYCSEACRKRRNTERETETGHALSQRQHHADLPRNHGRDPGGKPR